MSEQPVKPAEAPEQVNDLEFEKTKDGLDLKIRKWWQGPVQYFSIGATIIAIIIVCKVFGLFALLADIF